MKAVNSLVMVGLESVLIEDYEYMMSATYVTSKYKRDKKLEKLYCDL